MARIVSAAETIVVAELEAFIGGHPVALAVLAVGGLALVLIPLVTYLAARRSRKGPPDP